MYALLLERYRDQLYWDYFLYVCSRGEERELFWPDQANDIQRRLNAREETAEERELLLEFASHIESEPLRADLLWILAGPSEESVLDVLGPASQLQSARLRYFVYYMLMYQVLLEGDWDRAKAAIAEALAVPETEAPNDQLLALMQARFLGIEASTERIRTVYAAADESHRRSAGQIAADLAGHEIASDEAFLEWLDGTP